MNARPVLATVVSLLAVALLAASVWSMPRQGALDLTAVSDGPCAIRVVTLSDAVKAQGLRVGDVIRSDDLDLATRVRMNFPPPAGTSLTVAVTRGSTTVPVTLTYRSVPGLGIFGIFIRFWFVAIGLIAFWRGRDAASFGLGVFSCGISSMLGSGYSVLAVWPTIAGTVAVVVLSAAALLGLVGLASALSAPYFSPEWLRKAWLVSWAVAAVQCVGMLFADTVPTLTGCSSSWAFPVVIAAFSVQMGLSMSMLGRTMRVAPAAVRGRVRWIYWSTVIGFLGPLYGAGLIMLHLPLPPDDWYNLTILLIPLGYTYAVLRHRVIDVGFVINRALVYGALTTVIVGVLAIAESLLANATVGRGTGIAVEMAVALGLGLSFNALHSRIDVLIDRIFFRKKHEAEKALAQLGHESAYIERPSALLDRAIEDFYGHSGASGCAVYERDGETYRLARERGEATFPASVDADDGAFVRMRASTRDVDLEDVDSALGSAGLGVPMVVRGSLIGALALTQKKDGEPYAPDERALLLTATREVAAALNAMQAKENADLVGAIATGLIDARAAQTRARELRSST